jgi:hypothetical protein
MPWLQWGFERACVPPGRWGFHLPWDSKAGERFKRRLDCQVKKADGEGAKIERIGPSIHSPVQGPDREFALKDRPDRYAWIGGNASRRLTWPSMDSQLLVEGR